MTLLFLSGRPLAFPWGVLFSARVVETQGYLDLLCTSRPQCFNQDSNLINNHGYWWDRYLSTAGLAGQASFKAEKSLTTCEQLCRRLSRMLLFSWGIFLKKTKCYPFGKSHNGVISRGEWMLQLKCCF